MTDVRIAAGEGDVYCPRCASSALSIWYDDQTGGYECAPCGWLGHFDNWVFDPTIPDWVWPDGKRPNPGCPWCTSCNITYFDPCIPGRPAEFTCRRSLCGKAWRGHYTRYAGGRMRWTIRIDTSAVPHRPV